MIRYVVYLLSSLCVILAPNAQVQSQENALKVDRYVDSELKIHYPNDRNILPDESDFIVINYVLMSSDEGERWAVITLKNTAAGVRLFQQNHVLALFADGQRLPANKYKLSFKANETISINLDFGDNKFPILAVFTRDNAI